MAGGGINFLCLFLALLATVGFIFTTAYWEWKRNSTQSSAAYLTGTYVAEGIWLRCYIPQPGQFRCDSFDVSFIGLPAEIQAMRAMMCLSVIFSAIAVTCSIVVLPCINYEDRQKTMAARVGGVLLILAAELQAQRAMMVIATIFAVFGVISAIVGMDCVSVMEGTRGKVWTGRTGGGMMIIAGLLCLASVSWYAANVVYEFFDIELRQSQLQQQQEDGYRYEFGSSLYVGWVAAGLAIISGILLTCCNCGGNDKDDYTYSYKPPHSNKPTAGKTAEYV